MAAETKEPEINRDCLRGKKQITMEAKKISQEGEEGETEILIRIYFTRG